MSDKTHRPISSTSNTFAEYSNQLRERDKELEREDLSVEEVESLTEAILIDDRVYADHVLGVDTSPQVRRQRAHLRKQFSTAYRLLLESLTSEAKKLPTGLARERFLRERALDWERLLPRHGIVDELVSGIEQLAGRAGTLGPEAEALGAALGENEFAWGGSTTDFGLWIDHIYTKYVGVEGAGDGDDDTKSAFHDAMASHFIVRKHGVWQPMNSTSSRQLGARRSNRERQAALVEEFERQVEEHSGDSSDDR